MELDERVTLASAEGIDLDLALAGIGSRSVAFLVDLLLEGLALVALAAVGSAFGSLGVAFYAVASFLVLLGYPILAEAFVSGRTVGKALLRISVVSVDGTPITFLAAVVVRNVLRFVDALPGTYFVGLTSILVTRRNQRIGDLAADTLVIHRASGPQAVAAGVDGGLGLGAVPVGGAAGWDVASVSGEEVAAARSFLLRRAELDPRHRAELAQTLANQLLPKVAGVPLDGGPERFLERVVGAKTGHGR